MQKGRARYTSRTVTNNNDFREKKKCNGYAWSVEVIGEMRFYLKDESYCGNL